MHPDNGIEKKPKQCWQPIDTAPRDGRVIMLACWTGDTLNWATRGQWHYGKWRGRAGGMVMLPTHWAENDL